MYVIIQEGSLHDLLLHSHSVALVRGRIPVEGLRTSICEYMRGPGCLHCHENAKKKSLPDYKDEVRQICYLQNEREEGIQR